MGSLLNDNSEGLGSLWLQNACAEIHTLLVVVGKGADDGFTTRRHRSRITVSWIKIPRPVDNAPEDLGPGEESSYSARMLEVLAVILTIVSLVAGLMQVVQGFARLHYHFKKILTCKLNLQWNSGTAPFKKNL